MIAVAEYYRINTIYRIRKSSKIEQDFYNKIAEIIDEGIEKFNP